MTIRFGPAGPPVDQQRLLDAQVAAAVSDERARLARMVRHWGVDRTRCKDAEAVVAELGRIADAIEGVP